MPLSVRNQILMQKKWFFLSYLCAFWFYKPMALAADTLVLLADYWYPVNAEPLSEREGLGIDLMRGIFKEKKVSIDYRITPWKRSIYEVERGAADCVIGAGLYDAPGLLFPSEPMILDVSAAYHLVGSDFVYQNLDSLLKWRIGLVTGYSYGSVFDDFIKKHPNPAMLQYIAGDNPLEVNLKKLIAGHIDLIVESDMVMQATLNKKHFKKKVKRLSFIGNQAGLYIACSPKKETTKQYLQWWDEGIRAWRANGKLAEGLAAMGFSNSPLSVHRGSLVCRLSFY